MLGACRDIVTMEGVLSVAVIIKKGRIEYMVAKPSWLAYSCDDSERYVADGVDALLSSIAVGIIKKSVGARIAYTKAYNRYLLAGRCVENPGGLEGLDTGGVAYAMRAPQICRNNSKLILDTACVYKQTRYILRLNGRKYIVPGGLALCGGNQDIIPCLLNTMGDWLAVMVPKHYEGLEEKLGCWRVNREKKYFKVCWRRIPEDRLTPVP